MLAHLRTGAYQVYRTPIYPPAETRAAAMSVDQNVRSIETAKQKLESRWRTGS